MVPEDLYNQYEEVFFSMIYFDKKEDRDMALLSQRSQCWHCTLFTATLTLLGFYIWSVY